MEIPTVKLTLDGGLILQLRNYEQYTISSEWTTEGKDIILDGYESYIIKVNEEEKVEWILKIDDIYNLFEIDNGYIITGDFYDEIDPNDTVAGETI